MLPIFYKVYMGRTPFKKNSAIFMFKLQSMSIPVILSQRHLFIDETL